MSICLYDFISKYIYTSIYAYLCMSIYLYLYIYKCVYLDIHTYIGLTVPLLICLQERGDVAERRAENLDRELADVAGELQVRIDICI